MGALLRATRRGDHAPAALKFVNGSSDIMSCGFPTHLQDFLAGTMIVWAYPTAWPAAGVRSVFNINGGHAGYRQLSTAGSGGTLGLRFLLDKDTADLTISATPANVPHAAANKWCRWAAVWDNAGAAGAQKLYGGDLRNLLTEVTTYAAQTAGTGTALTSSNSDVTAIGGGFPGSIFAVALWNRALSVAELHQRSDDLATRRVPIGAIGCWFFGAHGAGRVWDESGRGAHGTITGAVPAATLPELARWPSRPKIRAKAPTAGILRQMLQHAH